MVDSQCFTYKVIHLYIHTHTYICIYDCSLPGSSIHGIFQARTLEWVSISFSRRYSQPRDWTRASCIVDRHFTIWTIREVHIYRYIYIYIHIHICIFSLDICWRTEWQPTLVFLLRECHGQRSLAGHSPWGCKESDTTEGLTLSFTIYMHYIYVHTHIYILFFIFFSIMLLWDSECSFLFYIHSRTLLFTYFIYCSVYLSKPNL